MVEVDRVSCEVVAVVSAREHRLEDAYSAEWCRVVIVDITGDKVQVWGRLSASLQGEVLSQRESG